jgi:hypothetical protein
MVWLAEIPETERNVAFPDKFQLMLKQPLPIR